MRWAPKWEARKSMGQKTKGRKENKEEKEAV
jgi:hypothetical protein